MWKFDGRQKTIFDQIISGNKLIYEKKLESLPKSPTIREVLSKGIISYREVDALYRELPKSCEFFRFVESLNPNFSFFDALRKNEVSSEYEERIKRLKKEQADREYGEMTKTIDTGRSNKLRINFGMEYRNVNRQMMVVMNTLLTVAGAFVFGYFGIQFIHPSIKYDMSTKMITGLVISTIVFFADLYFIVKNMD